MSLVNLRIVLSLCLLPVLARPCPAGEWRFGPGQEYPGLVGSARHSAVWDPDGVGPQEPVLVVAGFVRGVCETGARFVMTWDGSHWASFDNGLWESGVLVQSLFVHKGDLYLGGEFYTESAVPYTIARWNSVEWEPMNLGDDGSVNCFCEHGGDLIVGGNFSDIGGISAENIARWDGAQWWALGAGLPETANDGVKNLVSSPEGILASGRIVGILDPADGIHDRIVRWDGVSWSAFAQNLRSTYSVLDFAVAGGAVYACGLFLFESTTATARTVVWDGAAWQPVGAPGSTVAVSLFVLNDELYAGGSKVHKWTGESWVPSGPNTTVTGIEELQWFREAWVILGSFSTVNGLSTVAHRIAFEDTAKQLWAPACTGLSGGVWCIARYQNDVVVAGDFQRIGSQFVGYIAKWDGAEWTPLSSGLSAPTPTLVSSMTTFEDDLYVCGSIRTAGGMPVDGIAKWDGSTWSAVGTGVDHSFGTLRVHDGALYAAGSGTGACVSVWDGVSWSSVGPEMRGTVSAMTFFDGKLTVAGRIAVDGGALKLQVVQLSGNMWVQLGTSVWNPSPAASIATLLEWNGGLYAGGTFGVADGIEAQNVALWNGEFWEPVGQGFNNSVRTLAQYGGALYAAGNFSKSGPLDVFSIARWNGTRWNALDSTRFVTWSSVASPYGIVDLEADEELLVAGYFNEMSPLRTVGYWARWYEASLPACGGDANGDLFVDGRDLSVLLSNFGDDSASESSGDFNGDGTVNGLDLSVLLLTYGQSCTN